MSADEQLGGHAAGRDAGAAAERAKRGLGDGSPRVEPDIQLDECVAVAVVDAPDRVRVGQATDVARMLDVVQGAR